METIPHGHYIVRWDFDSPMMFAEYDGKRWDFGSGDKRYGRPFFFKKNPILLDDGVK
jgi:hypothetical protein